MGFHGEEGWHWTSDSQVVYGGTPIKGPEDRLRYGGYLAWVNLVPLCLTYGFWEGLQKEVQIAPVVQDRNKVAKS